MQCHSNMTRPNLYSTIILWVVCTLAASIKHVASINHMFDIIFLNLDFFEIVDKLTENFEKISKIQFHSMSGRRYLALSECNISCPDMHVHELSLMAIMSINDPTYILGAI